MYSVQGLVVVSGAVTVAGGWEALGLWWELPPCNVFIKWELLLIMWEQPGTSLHQKGARSTSYGSSLPVMSSIMWEQEESSLINWEQFNPSHSISILWEPPLIYPHPEVNS